MRFVFSQCDVVVLAAPSRPQGPLVVSDVLAERCKISWKHPEDDGGEPILGYILRRMDTKTGQWEKVGEILIDKSLVRRAHRPVVKGRG